MKRFELIFSQAIESDVLAALDKRGIAKAYTKIPEVMGRGNSNPKMGDSVWPELNCMYILYCNDEDTAKMQEIAEAMHAEYPCDGIACFMTDAQSL